MVFPTVFSNPSAIPGGDAKVWNDAYYWLWAFWWFRKAVMELKNPFLTGYLYYPEGTNLYYSPLIPVVSFVMIPLQLSFGSVTVAYLVLVLSLVGSAYFAYRLAIRFTQDPFASFVAGMGYGFCSYVLTQTANAHLERVAGMPWIPLTVLYLLKSIEKTTIKNIIIASISFSFSSLAGDSYNIVFLSIFYLLLMVWKLITGDIHIREKRVVKLAFIPLLSLVILSPVLLPTVFTPCPEAVRPLAESMSNSEDTVALFVPSALNPFLGRYVREVRSRFSGFFLGYGAMALGAYGLVKERRKTKFWLFSFLLFTTLSFGPVLQVFGQSEFLGLTIPLPYLILYYVPFINVIRSANRFIVMSILSLCLASSIGLKRILQRVSSNGLRSSVLRIVPVASIVAFMMFESCVTMNPTDMTIPGVYHKFAAESEEFAILEVPVSPSISVYQFYQTVHGKPIVGGYLGRENPYAFVLYAPVARQLRKLDATLDIFRDELANRLSVFAHHRIKFIVAHKDLLSAPELATVESILLDGLSIDTPFHEDKLTIVYRVPWISKPMIFFGPAENWYRIESWGNISARWISNNARTILFNPSREEKEVTLEFSVTSFHKPRTLRILVNNGLVIAQRVPTHFTPFSLRFTIQGGQNSIIFVSAEGSETPASLGINPDIRSLSFAFQNIKITEL